MNKRLAVAKWLFYRFAILIAGYIIISSSLDLLSATNSFVFFQSLTANSICYLQGLLGAGCYAEGYNIIYGAVTASIEFWCLGIDQVLFISLLLGVIGGRRSLPMIITGAGVMIVLNIIRLMMFGLIAVIVGVSQAVAWHHAWYFYGQSMLMLLAVIIISFLFQDRWQKDMPV